MTSNLGSEAIVRHRGPLGFTAGGQDEGSLRDAVMRQLRETFRPEFLNRIDEIVVFRQLDAEQLARITDLMLDETRRRLAAQGITLVFSPEAVAWLAERGYEPAFGARPLRRVIQREVDNPLSRLLLTSDVHAGQQILVTVAGDTLRLEVTDRSDGTEPNTAAEAPESAEV